MSLWDTLFNLSAKPATDQPVHRFGRYTDAYKPTTKYTAYGEAAEAFEEGDFLGSVATFMEYLSDETEENVKWKAEPDRVVFELYQGSKRVTGLADREQLRATAKIARLGTLDAKLLQRLTDMNFQLKYSRFALDREDCLTIVFDTPVHDASPYKLYHALKEMALRADKQDDLLIEEFGEALSPVEITHLEPISAPERTLKLSYLHDSIQGVVDYLATNRINPEEHPGAVAYLLLDLVYRLDYLLTPEGHTMEALERMHRMYFAREDERPVTYKNVRLLGELQQLQQRAPESFAGELYAGKSTFGITLPASHDRLSSLIANELANMDWYEDNGFPEIAQAIPGYIAGYALFNYAVPLPDRELLHLYYRVTDEAYFQQLGYRQQLVKNGRPSRRAVRSAVSELVSRYKSEYPWFRPAINLVGFGSMLEFSRGYLEMIGKMDTAG